MPFGVENIDAYQAPAVHPKDVLMTALNDLVHDFGDGRVIQVRPKDIQNIRDAMELIGPSARATMRWRMLDNKTSVFTHEELRIARRAGMKSVAALWADYIGGVE